MTDALIKAYGRLVPLRICLSSGFDGSVHLLNKVGDVLPVAIPPEGMELDESSIWVELSLTTGGKELTRIYDHEYEVVL